MGVVNELTSQDFTARFSKKNLEVNKVDIPKALGSVQLRLQSQFFIPNRNNKEIVLTKMGVTAKERSSCIRLSFLHEY